LLIIVFNADRGAIERYAGYTKHAEDGSVIPPRTPIKTAKAYLNKWEPRPKRAEAA
jgi:hypothetical protein